MKTLPTRIFDILETIRSRPGGQVIFSSMCNGSWRDYTHSEYLEYVNLTSLALINFGIRIGEPVLSITNNRAEFNFVDMGILQTGAVHVPLYPAIDIPKLQGILTETGARIAFISNRSVLRKIMQIPECPLKLIVSFDKTDDIVFYEDFLHDIPENTKVLNDLIAAVQPGDPASIIYLSGSNTPLRGVVLSHSSHVFNLLSYCKLHHFKDCKQSISFLPLAHSFERTLNFTFQYLGIRICYSDSIASLTGLLKQMKPDAMQAVPLVLDRILETYKQEILKAPGYKRWLAQSFMNLASETEACSIKSKLLFRNPVSRIVFSGLRNVIGGNVKVLLCGGAALRSEVLNILWAAGINTFEGYGLTEAGPLVSYNNLKNYKAYSVGKPMHDVQVKIASDHEVLVKSGGIRNSYFGHNSFPVSVDGWLHTGDTGSIDNQGFLTLTGTKKDIFKLSSGLYTDPRPIETILAESKYIDKIWIYGQSRTSLTAVVLPVRNKHSVNASAIITGTGYSGSFINTSQIREMIQEDINAYNLTCQKYDQVTKYEIVEDEWTTQNGLLKPDGSYNRQALYAKYYALIEGMYC